MIKFHKLDGTGKFYYLNESNNLSNSTQASKFAYKVKRGLSTFREYFGIIVDPNATIEDIVGHEDIAKHEEYHGDLKEFDDLYKKYKLDKKYIIRFSDKDIPIYIPKEYITDTPLLWYGKKRSKEELARSGKTRQTDIYNYYKHNIDSSHLHSLSEVKTTSVASLYQYLHEGSEKWKTGFERYGYVDGLWETGGLVTVAVDSGEFRLHTAVHELGHSMSYYLNDDWFDRWVAIGENMSEEPPTDYGKTEISEDFAESYGLYFSSANGKSVLEKTCPNRFAYMQGIESGGPDVFYGGEYKPNNKLNRRFAKFDEVVFDMEAHVNIDRVKKMII